MKATTKESNGNLLADIVALHRSVTVGKKTKELFSNGSFSGFLVSWNQCKCKKSLPQLRKLEPPGTIHTAVLVTNSIKTRSASLFLSSLFYFERSTMAFRSNSASLATLLSLLLSLRSSTSFSLNPSYPTTRIEQLHIATSSPSPCHVHHRARRRYRHVIRQTAVEALSAPPLDDWEPNNDNFSRRKTTRTRIATFLHSCYTRYLNLCENRPFPTNSITAGVLAGMGDILAQSLQMGCAAVGISSFNWVRWRTFMLTGLLFEGPWMSFWYNGLTKLARWMESKFQSGPRQQVLGQVVADQTLGVVLFYPTFFVVYECIGAFLSGQGKYVNTNAWSVCADVPVYVDVTSFT
jgi:hypothetical protein